MGSNTRPGGLLIEALLSIMCLAIVALLIARTIASLLLIERDSTHLLKIVSLASRSTLNDAEDIPNDDQRTSTSQVSHELQWCLVPAAKTSGGSAFMANKAGKVAWRSMTWRTSSGAVRTLGIVVKAE